MENPIYLGLSLQQVRRTNMDIIANNIANMNTPGYRAQNTIFSEYLSSPIGSSDPLSFVMEHGQFQKMEEGPVSYTGNALDVSLNGPGFIGVVGPGGETHYTRAGNFTLDSEGTLITSTNHPVADDGGGPIQIPKGSTEINIDDNGRISNQDGEIARIMISEFENIQHLNPVGATLYKASAQPKEAENTIMRQGSLEGSNVEPILEMTRMIDNMRSYQSTQRLLQNENERLRSAIQHLTGGGKG